MGLVASLSPHESPLLECPDSKCLVFPRVSDSRTKAEPKKKVFLLASVHVPSFPPRSVVIAAQLSLSPGGDHRGVKTERSR